jgi:competence protein ComGC
MPSNAAEAARVGYERSKIQLLRLLTINSLLLLWGCPDMRKKKQEEHDKHSNTAQHCVTTRQ